MRLKYVDTCNIYTVVPGVELAHYTGCHCNGVLGGRRQIICDHFTTLTHGGWKDLILGDFGYGIGIDIF